MKIYSIALFVLAIFTSAASAQISLAVNVALKEISFTGSDNGTAQDLGGIGTGPYIVSWQNGAGSGPNVNLDVSSGFSTTFTQISNLVIYENFDAIRLVLGNSATTFSNVTANGAGISYAGLDQVYIDRIEAANGKTLLLNQGSGFDDVAVAVPEPSQAGLLLGLLAACLLLRRRAVR
jgi:hypothetical protein